MARRSTRLAVSQAETPPLTAWISGAGSLARERGPAVCTFNEFLFNKETQLSIDTDQKDRMHSSKTVLVLGATGKQGGAVVIALKARVWCVRALVRNPDSGAAKAMASNGI